MNHSLRVASVCLAAYMCCMILCQSVHGYNWPLQPATSAHPINGTLGEYRAGPPLHLHDGVDIGGSNGESVYSIDGGTAVRGGAGENTYVQVGEKFYIHLDDRIPDLSSVTPGMRLGRIRAGSGHVHLREGYEGPIVNPLRSGGLTPYTDSSSPVVLSIEVVKDCTPA